MILTCHGIAGAGCDVQGGSSKEDDVLRKAWQQVQLSSCHGGAELDPHPLSYYCGTPLHLQTNDQPTDLLLYCIMKVEHIYNNRLLTYHHFHVFSESCSYSYRAAYFSTLGERSKLLFRYHNSLLLILPMEWRTCSGGPVYGSASGDPLRFKRAVGHKDLFYIDDREVDFKEIIEAHLQKTPLDTSAVAHWLAIEGILQPAILSCCRSFSFPWFPCSLEISSCWNCVGYLGPGG